MEQTSSAAYPNILVVDYVKKARVASPQLLMKSEQFLNVGYQKLLTFERPGGGFDWWGHRRAARLAQRLRPARVQRHGQGLPHRPGRHRPHPGLPPQEDGQGRHL